MNNQAVEIVFSFDVTGSMSPAIAQVRKNIEQILTPLFQEIPNLKIGLVAHGDYYDLKAPGGFTTKWCELTSSIYDLTQFVRTVPKGYGGRDGGECYELVLHEARQLNWSLNSKKVLVVIGDDIAHSATFPGNTLNLNWRDEVDALRKIGVTVNTVRALRQYYATEPFYTELADRGYGHALRLDQFYEIQDLIMAIVYSQVGSASLAAYEAKVIAGNRMSRTLDNSFSSLSGRKTSGRYDNYDAGLVPVDLGRFQILSVDNETPIKEFVQDNNLPFKLGRGFYQFTKTEDIQETKEVVLRDKFSGDMFTGNEARNMIGVPFGVRDRLKPASLSKYDIFVQSTSVNRKLKPNTKFLYEVAA